MQKGKQSYSYAKVNSNDENYTKQPLVDIILPFLATFAPNPSECTIWCPFDVTEPTLSECGTFFIEPSKYVTTFKKLGYKVITTHLVTGTDFLKVEDGDFDYDVIISNPPFQEKKLFFEKAIELGKPFMLLSRLDWLNDRTPNLVFGDKLQLIIPDRRATFYQPTVSTTKAISFKSAYFGMGFTKENLNLVMMEDDRKLPFECFDTDDVDELQKIRDRKLKEFENARSNIDDFT